MLYAAYGSNLHPVRLAKRLASAKLIGTAHLEQWSLCFHKRSKDQSGKCSIISDPGGVHFAVFDISAGDKLILDEIEGVGQGYSAISLDVPIFGTCASYIAEQGYIDDSLLPYGWYKELVLAGARFHGFPDQYVAQIESVRASEDPDSLRQTRQWKLVRAVNAGPQGEQ